MLNTFLDGLIFLHHPTITGTISQQLIRVGELNWEKFATGMSWLYRSSMVLMNVQVHELGYNFRAQLNITPN
jgi:hypothetical protein